MRKLILIFVGLFIALILSAQPLIVAHRGASNEAVQNTLNAFKIAYTCGAKAAECDVWLSKDGELVVSHDKDLKKVAPYGEKYVISEMNWSELKNIQLTKNERLCRLDEILEIIPADGLLLIELKGQSDKKLAQKLATKLKSLGLKPTQIIVISFNEQYLALFHKAAPEYPIGVNYSYKPERKAAMQKGEIDFSGYQYVGCHYRLLSKELMAYARAHNVKVCGWTIDSTERAEKIAKSFQVDYICTNRPREMVKFFSEKNSDK